MTTRSAQEVLDFWFVAHGPADWFAGTPAFDREVEDIFLPTHLEVSRGEAWQWRATPEGRVAEIIVLDQFSRQLFRGSDRAFAQDAMALALAQEAVGGGYDKALAIDHRKFLLMPFMHSESIVVHEDALRLFNELGDEVWLGHEAAHRTCVSRFGRYPARNAALGRVSTPEELDYLASLSAAS